MCLSVSESWRSSVNREAVKLISHIVLQLVYTESVESLCEELLHRFGWSRNYVLRECFLLTVRAVASGFMGNSSAGGGTGSAGGASSSVSSTGKRPVLIVKVGSQGSVGSSGDGSAAGEASSGMIPPPTALVNPSVIQPWRRLVKHYFLSKVSA